MVIPNDHTPDHLPVGAYFLSNSLCSTDRKYISKVLEIIFFNKIYNFVIESSISSFQFGFVRNRSTLKQLLLHTIYILRSIDDHKQVDTILLDIKKVFGSIPQEKLLSNLWNIGIR